VGLSAIKERGLNRSTQTEEDEKDERSYLANKTIAVPQSFLPNNGLYIMAQYEKKKTKLNESLQEVIVNGKNNLANPNRLSFNSPQLGNARKNGIS